MNVQETNLKAVEQWIDNYNNDTDRMATESYAPDYVAQAMGLATIEGVDNLKKLEDVVTAAAPDRVGKIVKAHSAGDTVIVEATLTYTNSEGEKIETPWCAVLSFRDGKIISDHTYLDKTLWPGLG
jgi:ketosteroid isomerase-like protein